MSNANVGGVYDHIISEVINAVRVDFEENGVDDGVLEELKKVRRFSFPVLSISMHHALPSFSILILSTSIKSSLLPFIHALSFARNAFSPAHLHVERTGFHCD